VCSHKGLIPDPVPFPPPSGSFCPDRYPEMQWKFSRFHGFDFKSDNPFKRIIGLFVDHHRPSFPNPGSYVIRTVSHSYQTAIICCHPHIFDEAWPSMVHIRKTARKMGGNSINIGRRIVVEHSFLNINKYLVCLLHEIIMTDNRLINRINLFISLWFKFILSGKSSFSYRKNCMYKELVLHFFRCR